MLKQEIIKGSLDYIEANLKTDITVEELARIAHYSTYHYYHLFSALMKTSVVGYIMKRRLDHALSELASGRKGIDVVLEYGFDTYAGFYKAFIKMYGCSPKKYISIYHDHKPKKTEVTTMHTEKELRDILRYWDIAKDLSIGNVNTMDGQKVSDTLWTIGSDYMLKTGQREKLIKDLRVAKALEKVGFGAALPIQTLTGGDYLDGREIFILTQRLEGSPLPKSDRFGDNRVGFGEKYGESLARLHKALRQVQPDVLLDEVNLYRIVTDWALPAVRQQNLQWNMGLDEAFFEGYMSDFKKLYDHLPRQLIHRNPHPGNILFKDGAVTGFIDFDLSEVNIRLWDVCYCSTGILSETTEEHYEKWLDVLSGILHGYDRESTLTIEEKQAVYSIIISISMVFAAHLGSREDLKQLADTNRKILTFIVKHKDHIDRMF